MNTITNSELSAITISADLSTSSLLDREVYLIDVPPQIFIQNLFRI